MVQLRLVKLLTVGMVMFLGASLVVAQEQPQRNRQGGGGGGGRGGFGGGFGGSRGILSLITNEAVQKDLTVDADTVAKLKKVADDSGADSRKEMEGLGGPPGGGQDLSAEERQKRGQEMAAKMTEIRAKIRAKYSPQLQEILSETQYTRLQQIYWQSSLNAALSDAAVIKAIELTKEQQDKIAALGKEYEEKQRGLFGGAGGAGAGAAGGGFQEAMVKMQEMTKEREKKVTDVLSADQKTKFATLKGKEFDVSKLRPNFGGGRGGPGGRPAGAGGRPAGAGGRPTEDKKAEDKKAEEKKAEEKKPE